METNTKIKELLVILVGLSLIYKYTTQKKPYIYDPQTQLTTSLLFQKSHYMFRPLRAIFRWYF
jgi:hypothetical protein